MGGAWSIVRSSADEKTTAWALHVAKKAYASQLSKNPCYRKMTGCFSDPKAVATFIQEDEEFKEWTVVHFCLPFFLLDLVTWYLVIANHDRPCIVLKYFGWTGERIVMLKPASG
jgi:hypothetical protein